MPENITYHKLIKWHQELQALKVNDHILARFLSTKIAMFYKQNGTRIDSFIKRCNEVDKFWIQHTDDGVMIFEGNGMNRVKKLIEGRTKEEYEAVTKPMWDEVVVVDL